jgi:biotin-dependent carboxylase-like uncharacterized protein
MATLTVLATGPLTTVQDLGRPGFAASGVGPSGAADRSALRLANRLVGNPEGAAGLEVTLGGLRLRPDADVVLALAGARCPVTVDGRPAAHRAALRVPAGAEVALGAPATGLRTCCAVAGGIAVAPVLGSRSTDLLAGLGPPVVRAGDVLPIGGAAGAAPALDLAPGIDPPGGVVTLDAIPGPREGWFAAAALDRLGAATWSVGARSDRVGLRLDGPALRRSITDELPSEGLVRGALQVPPSGRPTLLLADHPVTGGYPVIAVVVDADVDRAAQLRPGQGLRVRLRRPPR